MIMESQSKSCMHEGCRKAASFGFQNGERQFCSTHMRPGMEYLKNQERPQTGHVPRGLDYAPSVSREPEVEDHKRSGGSRDHCRHSGCSKAASFGFPGGERQFCSSHKTSGMEYLKHSGGDAEEALSKALDHVPRGLDHRPSLVSDRQSHTHRGAREHIGEQSHPHCQEEGCTRAPSYAWSNETHAIFCSQHKRPSMVYLRHAEEYHDPHHHGTSAGAPGHIPRGLEYIPSVAMESDRIVHSDHPHCHHPTCTK
ncbi:unnamed protein product, partial [Discosporangium mesarthrocarpum]